MNAIEILANGSYLPSKKIENTELNERFVLAKDWIEKRTGISTRYEAQTEEIEEMAIKAVKEALKKVQIDIQEIGQIIVATTSSKHLMPGISFMIQKALQIKKCKCMDILAGCSGYINAIDSIRKSIVLEEIKYGLVVGVEKLSEYTNKEDLGTAILLGDGAGATLIGKAEEQKEYRCCIESITEGQQALTCRADGNIQMDGKAIYKFAVTKTVENIQKLLEESKENIEDIKYIVPHQSNKRILEAITQRLQLSEEKMYCNIKEVGNIFNASIPIALDELWKKRVLKKNDKIILVGYGGGLNLGSILLEI